MRKISPFEQNPTIIKHSMTEVTSKINLKTLFTMPMAPPPNKLSLHAKKFEQANLLCVVHRNEKNITIWAEPYNHKTWHDRRVKYVTSKINLKTLFTMPMAPPPNKLSLHAKQFDGKTKERQFCARFTAVIAVYGRTKLSVPCPGPGHRSFVHTTT